MLTPQARQICLRGIVLVQVGSDLRDGLPYQMSPHDMMREDACHVTAAECHLRGQARGGEVQKELAILVDSALHGTAGGLVDYVHVRMNMQVSCRNSTRPILHSSTRPQRLTRDTIINRC